MPKLVCGYLLERFRPILVAVVRPGANGRAGGALALPLFPAKINI